jgi:hypothetical protein
MDQKNIRSIIPSLKHNSGICAGSEKDMKIIQWASSHRAGKQP